jgi:hypothetical protein
LIETSCLSYQIKGNICNSDILFQYRAMPAPFGIPLTKNE